MGIRRFLMAMFGAAAAVFWGCSPKTSAPVYRELSAEDTEQLDRQRALILEEAKQRYGVSEFTGDEADLDVIQRFVDDLVFGRQDSYQWQSLGVVYGDVMAKKLGMRWVIVTDEFGTDPVLRYENTTIQLNPLTMISKRIEDGSSLDVSSLLDAIGGEVQRMIETGEFE